MAQLAELHTVSSYVWVLNQPLGTGSWPGHMLRWKGDGQLAIQGMAIGGTDVWKSLWKPKGTLKQGLALGIRRTS